MSYNNLRVYQIYEIEPLFHSFISPYSLILSHFISIPILDFGGWPGKNSNSMVTLFTFNRAVWQLRQKIIIENYGYIDEQERQSLYSTVFHGQPNPQHLKIEIDNSKNKVHLYHKSGILLATWSIFTIVGKFISKLERLLVVLADNQLNDESEKEEFLFNEAYLLENPSPDNFINAFENSQIAIDLRMHLKSTGTVRNHGTGFRIKENNILNLYADRKQIL